MGPSGFDQPAVYRITVAGYLSLDWFEILRAMAIENGGEQAPEHATVTGHLPDQAALLGVLNALYDRRVTLLAVERLAGSEI